MTTGWRDDDEQLPPMSLEKAKRKSDDTFEVANAVLDLAMKTLTRTALKVFMCVVWEIGDLLEPTDELARITWVQFAERANISINGVKSGLKECCEKEFLKSHGRSRYSIALEGDFEKGHTEIPEWVYKTVMPALRSVEFSVFLCVLRKTWGWKKKGQRNKDRKQWDWIAWSQFMEMIKLSNDGLQAGIEGCRDKGYIIRELVKPGYPAYGYKYSISCPPNKPESESPSEGVVSTPIRVKNSPIRASTLQSE